MEIYQFRQLLAVAETNSFTRAAERLNVSQPALSAGISKLEEELGVVLVHRDRRAVHLTKHGQRLAVRARQVLEVCSNARAEMRENDRLETIALGVMPSLPIAKISAIAKACVSAFPEISFDFREGHSAELHEMLGKGKLDLAFASSLTEEDGPLQARLLDEPYMLACHIDHPLARCGAISLSDIDGENFVLRTSCEARRATQDIMTERGIRTKVVARTAQDDRAFNLVAAGIGLALMPALFSGAGVARVPISDFSVSRTLVVRMNPKSKGAAEAVFNFLKEKDVRYL
ncbi:LysR family transcriptional regulator [Bradyrhizobium sp. USDA 10063]